MASVVLCGGCCNLLSKLKPFRSTATYTGPLIRPIPRSGFSAETLHESSTLVDHTYTMISWWSVANQEPIMIKLNGMLQTCMNSIDRIHRDTTNTRSDRCVFDDLVEIPTGDQSGFLSGYITLRYINAISNATYTLSGQWCIKNYMLYTIQPTGPARRLATQKVGTDQKGESAVQRRKLQPHSQYHFLDSVTWV